MPRERSRGGFVHGAGLVAGALMVVGPLLAWLRLVPAMVGFGLFVLGGLLALLVAIVAVVRAARGGWLPGGGVVALGAAAAFVVLASRGAGVPPINDFTTDLADPPAFRQAATLPANAGRDMAYPEPFAAIQRGCCSDLRAARVRANGVEVFARVRQVAERMPGWHVTAADPERGELEAIATTPLFGFQDDIVIRVRTDGEARSRVDMRSKSRDGRGDIGANAARIRAFVAALEAEGR